MRYNDWLALIFGLWFFILSPIGYAPNFFIILAISLVVMYKEAEQGE